MKPACFKDFEDTGERFLLDISELEDTRIKVAGIYCLFAPVELVRAAGAIPVSLCGKKEKPIADAERTLPRICARSLNPAMAMPLPIHARFFRQPIF